MINITDVRFPNEVAMCKEMGFRLVRLYRDTGKEDSISHASENVFDDIPDSDFDHIVIEEENTTLPVLKKRVIQILNAEGLLDL